MLACPGLRSFALFALSHIALLAATHPADLRCEYRHNPLGLDTPQPRLSWKMAVDDEAVRGASQTAYRIVVASTPERLTRHEGDLWDTGRVNGTKSNQIVYGGKPIASGSRAFWSVQIWDQSGQSSAWSEPASWSTGLLQASDWKSAQWIGLEPQPAPPPSDTRVLPARLLRKEFSTSGPVRRATAYVSGLGLSELYVNGQKISNDVLSPGLTDYDKRALYVTYDITPQIRSGANALGLQLGNGRYFAPRVVSPLAGRTFGYPKAKLIVELEGSDGSRQIVVSDSSWKLTDKGPIRSNSEYDGEDYDATAEIAGWAEPGLADVSWQPAQLVAAPAGVLAAQTAEPMRVMDHIQPKSVHEIRPGVFIFDMGQNMVGWCRLTVQGPRGTVVTLRHAETLQPDGDLYVANLRSAKATDHYTLKGAGTEVWQPRFTYHGFRYVELTGFPGQPSLSSLEGEVVHDGMEQAGSFVSSNQMLNRIYHNVFWGIRGNYRSIPTDCPQRDERQGWLGDRSVVSRSETYFFNVGAFYDKWSVDLQDAQNAAGTIPDVAPAFWPIYNDDVTWPSTFIQVPSMLYDQYGDLRVIAERYPAMEKWVAHMASLMKDGLLPKDTYGDWCVPPEDPKLIHSNDPARKTDGTLLATAYFYWMNHQMERFARLLDKPTNAVRYHDQAEQLKLAFNRAYLNRDSGWYANNTQTANILPLAFGLVPDDYRARVTSALIDNIEHKSDNHVATGLVGVQWLMRTLTEAGRADLALTIATQPTYPGWGYMVTKDATTVWELWNGDTADPAMNSGNHVMQMGDLGLWMFEDLAGIRPDPEHPGFQHILLRPQTPKGLDSVQASHQSPYGMIKTSWKREGAGVNLQVTIPPNTTALLSLPASAPNQLTEGGKPLSGLPGISQVTFTNGMAQIALQSGSYVFRTSAPLSARR